MRANDAASGEGGLHAPTAQTASDAAIPLTTSFSSDRDIDENIPQRSREDDGGIVTSL
jgi:hypothetical protein